MNFLTLLDVLRRPADGMRLALLRVLFGLAAAAAAAHLWSSLDGLFLKPKFLFSYPGLSWLEPWPGAGLFWQLGLMEAAAVAVALGLFYRWACGLLVLGGAYLILLDRTLYEDVQYLALMFSAVMLLLPAQQHWSLDARRGAPAGPVPLWAPLTAGFMLGALLLAAVLALLKLHEPGAGALGPELRKAGAYPALYALMFSAAGLLVLAVPRRTRQPSAAPAAAAVLPDTPRRVALLMLAAFVLLHLLLPLRALAVRADTGWLDQDQQPLSARECAAIFNVRDRAFARRWNVGPATRLNARQTAELGRQPEYVLQFARHLSELFAAPKYGAPDAIVRARIKCTVDGTRYALVLEPDRDLSRLTLEELLQARIPFDPDVREQRLRIERKK